MELLISTIIWVLILGYIIYKGRKNGNELRSRLNLAIKSRDNYIKGNKKIIKERNFFEDEAVKVMKDLKESRSSRNEISLKLTHANKKIEEIEKNAENMKFTFEDEIVQYEQGLQEKDSDLRELRLNIHKEQVAGNNFERSRDKWKAKFEALTHAVEKEAVGEQIIRVFKRNWKQIILAYNKAKGI